MTGKIGAWLFRLFSLGFQTTDTTVSGGRQAGGRHCCASEAALAAGCRPPLAAAGRAPLQMRFVTGWGTLGEAPQSWACGGPRGEPRGHMWGSTGGTCCTLAWGLLSSQGPLLSKTCWGLLQRDAPSTPRWLQPHTEHLPMGLRSSIELGF